jgi:small subunit ribosomal protein S5
VVAGLIHRLVVVGDGDIWWRQLWQGQEVPAAIIKGVERPEAYSRFRVAGTICPIRVRRPRSVVLKPASPGTGVIAGGGHAVLECAGVRRAGKSLGSDNAINVVHATVAALQARTAGMVAAAEAAIEMSRRLLQLVQVSA